MPWRLLAFAGGVLGLLALGGAAWWGLSRSTGPRSVPVIEADPRPVKIRPADPGGLRVGNQDEIIFDRNARTRAGPPAGAMLAPEPERPAFSELRAQVMPPPAPEPVLAVAPPPVPASVPPESPAAPPPSAAAMPSPEPAPAVAEPAPSATPGPVAGGRVAVQLGALPTEESARAEWDRLARRMPELLGALRPQIIRFDREGRPTMWRIRTGGFADSAAAGEFCERIRAGGGACAVLGG
jgi:hypothetical protein